MEAMNLKRIFQVFLTLTILIIFSFSSYASPASLDFSGPEREWIIENQNETLYLGLDPYTGMEYFNHQGMTKGYVLPLADLIESTLGMTVVVVGDQTWGEVYSGLETGEIDILFGANETPERLEWMAFTKPVYKYPYAAFARKDSTIQTIGDLDGKKMGIIEGDIIGSFLPVEYPNIDLSIVSFDEQYDGIEALISGQVDGFITAGDSIIYEFLYNYKDLKHLATIDNVTSDMTLSTRREDLVLAGILDKMIDHHQNSSIKKAIETAQVNYNRKILNLTPDEIHWLENDGSAVVGVADDYLPFDYFEDNTYKGITGALINEISSMLGVKFEVTHGSFAEVYEQALSGQVDVMNIAKTEARLEYFLYPTPFSEERDIIIGRKELPPVQDVYGLNGKTVAVVEGYWHEEYLTKNLKDVRIVITEDLLESLKLVRNGSADYMIENPTVIEYYIHGLGYTELIKKGVTSKDSYLYLGVTSHNPELASIINKVIPIIDYDTVKFNGISSVPEVRNERNSQLIRVVVLLLLALAIISLVLYRIFQALVNERTQTQVLKEREHLIYTDALTNLSNRLHYNHLEPTFDTLPFPQCVVIADLNYLKRTNDTYGHHAGDLLLQTFADVLKEALDTEFIFRMGGDEFMFIMTECNKHNLDTVLESINCNCKQRQLTMDDGSLQTPQAAFGSAIRMNLDQSLEDVTIQADNKMYQNKALLKRRKTDR